MRLKIPLSAWITFIVALIIATFFAKLTFDWWMQVR